SLPFSVRRKRKTGRPQGGGPFFGLSRRSGELRHLGSARALLAGDHLELDARALGEGAVAVALDVRVVDEDVLPVVGGDEAETLGVVEPLDDAVGHLGEIPESASAGGIA